MKTMVTGTLTVPFDVNSTTNGLLSASYDARGDVTAYGVYSYTWDSAGMLKTLNNGTSDFRYLYTADDERIAMQQISTYGGSTLNRWTWSIRDLDGQVLRVFTSSGGASGKDVWAWTEDYIYGPNGILASETPQGARHFHLDHLGTPRMITDGAGFKLSLHNYYPFGEEASGLAQDAEVRKFTGHERDMLSGNTTSGDSFDYMHARYYSPLNGRFLSPDPIGGDPFAPQSWNRYAYVLDDPVGSTDPTGQQQSQARKDAEDECPPGGCDITVVGQIPSEGVADALREFANFLIAARRWRVHVGDNINRRIPEGTLALGLAGSMVLPSGGVDASVGEFFHTGAGFENFGFFGSMSGLASGLDIGVTAQGGWTTGPLSNLSGLTVVASGGYGPVGVYAGGGKGIYSTVGLSLAPPGLSTRYTPKGGGHVSVGSTGTITLADIVRWIVGR